MQVIYKAFDGTQFYTKEECEHYENTQNLKRYEGIIRGLKRDLTTIKYSSPDFVDKATYISIPTYEAAQIFVSRCESEGMSCDGIVKEGVYKWDYEESEWSDIVSHIEELKDEISDLENIIEILEPGE